MAPTPFCPTTTIFASFSTLHFGSMSEAADIQQGADSTSVSTSPSGSALGHPSPTGSLKRRASLSCEDLNDTGSKRSKQTEEENSNIADNPEAGQPAMNALKLADELEEELLCGCCSELVYRPVVVLPCQHFFCGSCCVLWIKNGGSNCPACRSVSSIVIPCQPVQKIVDAYLRATPLRVRAERERAQADELYRPGTSMRIPSPRQASPEPNINLSREYIRPCPHCIPGNPYGWTCPNPIPDPNTDLNNAWHVDGGTPPGHAYCGNCENILATRAPTTSRCDFCLVAFCGIAVQGRCCALPLRAIEPHGYSDVGDLIQSPEVYRIFDDNMVEVEHVFDHLTSQRITPKLLFDEIVAHYQASSHGFQPMFDAEIFVDMYPVDPGTDSDPTSSRRRCCRMCAAEILLFGLYDWWLRQRQCGLVDETVMSRPNCPDGRSCAKQREHAHAKEFNHITALPIPPAADISTETRFPESTTNEATVGLASAPNPGTSAAATTSYASADPIPEADKGLSALAALIRTQTMEQANAELSAASVSLG